MKKKEKREIAFFKITSKKNVNSLLNYNSNYKKPQISKKSQSNIWQIINAVIVIIMQMTLY